MAIRGTDLSSAREVRFGNGAAVFTVENANLINATVPLDANSGPISIIASRARPNARSLSCHAADCDFSPTKLQRRLDRFGDNFEGATAVKFGSTNAQFVVNGPTQIQASYPPGPFRAPSPSSRLWAR